MTEQRACVKFCVKNGFKFSQVHEMMQKAFGEQAMSRSRVHEWYNRFRDGRESLEDDTHPGKVATVITADNIAAVREVVVANRRVTVREIEEELEIDRSSVQKILSNVLGVRRLVAKFVPKSLNFKQMNMRETMSRENLQAVAIDPGLMGRVITGDESWIYGFDSETQAQSSEWRFKNERRPTAVRRAKSKVKLHLTVFFDSQGIVHHEFCPTGSTITSESYVEVLRRLREAVRRKRPELWENQSWVLHHDNASPHTALNTSEFLRKNSVPVLPQPPYSPDLAPCDFFLFFRIKKHLKGKSFDTLDDIKAKTQEQLRCIAKEEFQACYEDWQKRWRKCITVHGDYFEGDHLQFED